MKNLDVLKDIAELPCPAQYKLCLYDFVVFLLSQGNSCIEIKSVFRRIKGEKK